MSTRDSSDANEANEEKEGGDEIVRCTADHGAVRIVSVTATDVAREAIKRHEATGAAAIALARGLTAGLLLATLTKDEERVTLQLIGGGPLGGMTIDATAGGTARGYVKHVVELEPPVVEGAQRPSIAGALGADGVVSVIRDLGLRESFRGQTAMASGEVDEDCERYLSESEQIDSALRCETLLDADGRLVAAAGLLVQALPGGRGAAAVSAARGRLHAGALAAALSADPRAADAGGLVETALGDVLGMWQALDARPVRFHCPCSRERAGATLALLGASELAAMILEDGKAEVICNFCRARHDFSEAELELIRRELGGSAGPPS
jgi:molecular chaperone Hsp33